jgi:hypothetical protein
MLVKRNISGSTQHWMASTLQRSLNEHFNSSVRKGVQACHCSGCIDPHMLRLIRSINLFCYLESKDSVVELYHFAPSWVFYIFCYPYDLTFFVCLVTVNGELFLITVLFKTFKLSTCAPATWDGAMLEFKVKTAPSL